MNDKTVPFARQADERRIVARLMCDGYSVEEIEAGFSLQAKTNGNFTIESVRKHIALSRPSHSAGASDAG